MKTKKILQISGTMLTTKQLERHLEKRAAEQNIMQKSSKLTYPVPHMLENFKIIQDVYNILNEHLKLGINIHPAGEWILDNLYSIEETVKMIQKELTLKKYINFHGISNGTYAGFSRVYVLASEIVAYTEGRIERENLESYLMSYQTKKTLSMDETWNIGLFLEISIIENIALICKTIYSSQLQKYKAETIAKNIIENKNDKKYDKKSKTKLKEITFKDNRYPFIEYMAYILKRYGKKGYSYLNGLEEIVEMTGTTISDIIKKEHFDIASKKVLIGNGISSIKRIQRLNFLEMFEKINGVEDLLKQDPAEVYDKMDYKTKEYYRTKIKEISSKTKISEIYITKKILEITKDQEEETKESHIGYYIIGDGINELYEKLGYKTIKKKSNSEKVKTYILVVTILSCLISILVAYMVNIKNIYVYILSTLIFLIPASEGVIQIIQWILGKIIKPKMIPKLDIENRIPKKDSTMVVIPTILNNKEKAKGLIEKLEVFYLANKSKNIYFTLLGDCTGSDAKEEPFDEEIVETGIKTIERLNEKYKVQENEFPIFNFMYRKRKWNEKQGKYLGWERKRGLLTELNEYLLGNIENNFRTNTIEKYKEKMPEIKYIITLDADTDLVLNSAFELIGTMAHILNKPVVNKTKNIVIDGHALIQPRVGVNLSVSNKNLFTKIFAGAGGIDLYTNAISDMYQDNFEEGIFTGKGIYDLSVFSKVLKNEIPENTVLSHDLLEGSYLRAGLASDIMIMDGYPEKYTSFMARLARWIRGDWQITKWLNKKSPLNTLSKFKIFDNLRRSLFEISTIIAYIYLIILKIIYNKNIWEEVVVLTTIVLLPFILEIVNNIVSKKQGEHKQKTFTPQITGFTGAISRGLITFSCLPYKAYTSIKAICKTIYRVCISHKNLLEWTTSEESEKQAKTDLFSYIKNMFVNIIVGIITILISIIYTNILVGIMGILWIISPYIMWYISRESNQEKAVDKVTKQEKEYVLDIGKRTWSFFEEYLNSKNNYLIPDNYQEGRKELIIPRTSSTNIGLSFLAVIAAYDLKYIKIDKAVNLIEKMLEAVNELPKWNGHLYNWYEIKTRKHLIPRYISTVDSGNFVGYMYVLKEFLLEVLEGKYENNEEKFSSDQIKNMLNIATKIIDETNFEVLYSKEHQIFSIGFNIEENKLTDSYYDLLASEARQASLIAIAKNDVPQKHWNNLSRTLTVVGKYKGLLSWSGTAFEYLMPNINIPKYEGSLLDESCKFMIMSQMEYAKKLNIPWGISESAFNVKDLHSNYQYKAFGVPWLGIKRGLADEMVVSSYGCGLAIADSPKEVIKNLKELEAYGMYNKYGFYESIDFTPQRVQKGKKASVVKTYMAHHQALMLLSINNFINDNIYQKRFVKNPEIEAVSILLQERTPEKSVITKETKEKVEKPKYVDYENYYASTYRKMDNKILRGNIISNENYTVAMDQKGNGVSKYKDIYINRFKTTKPFNQGIYMYVKNIKTKNIWNIAYSQDENMDNQYKVSFMPDKNETEKVNGNIKSKMENIVVPNEPVEIRRLTLENLGNDDEILEITSYFEPVLSEKHQDYAHQAFNNLFLVFGYDEDNKSIKIKRRKRDENEKQVFIEVLLNTENETIGDMEYEIDKEKFLGRGNLGIPKMVKNSIPFSKSIGLATEPIVALKRTVKVAAKKNVIIDFIISAGEDEKQVKDNMEKYKSNQNIIKEFELSKAKAQEECRYLGIKGKDIEEYQKLMTYIVFENPIKKIIMEKLPKEKYKQKELWKYGISGDFPVILLKIKDVNDSYVLKEVLKAYEYMKNKNVQTELVILDEEKHSYENFVKEEIESQILNSHLGYLKNIRSGIFSISKSEISKRDKNLFEFISSISIDCSKGGIKNNLRDLEERYIEQYKEIGKEINKPTVVEENQEDIDILANQENLKYYNEYGGFSQDGREYLIKSNKESRLPTVWSHILANENFGTVITENMGGYTWYKNSRLNRITTWENDATFDTPSEVIYLKEDETKKTWSLGQNPMPDNNNYNVIYGFGYAKYIHKAMGIEQTLEVFVPKKDTVKIGILNLKNNTRNRKKIKIIQYLNLTMGEDDIKSKGYIHTKFDSNSNMISSENLYNSDFEKTIMYVSSSEKIKSYTGDKKFFLGNGGISNPDALRKISLNNDNGFGSENCIAYEIEVEIESFSEKEISIIIGAEENIIDSKNMAYKYSKIQNCKNELKEVKYHWENIINRLQVYTPLESFNILLNGWIPYQTIESRLLARSGFYQSGGAIGFRDQLQDAFSLKYIDPNILKNQIIKHSKHQFKEGDVEHWWHDEVEKGIRTKFSDDLLWLVYGVCEYIEFTGDETILDIETPYVSGKQLEENEDEKYDIHLESEIKAPIFNHCIQALEKAINIGKNGIPKIGSGDWNDGFNKVGNKGEGESVWLGFFIYDILEKFIPICEKKEEINLVEKLKKYQNELKKALNTNGWDGRWYKRAFMDNGKVLGSMENDECKIDSIAQSWSVISNAGDNDKKYISMESLENHLVDRENGIIKLLDPPFEKGELEPGYIKSYLPGVRENGGQYTHAATWVIIAQTILGFGEKALELYRMINPIEHTRTKDAAQKYKAEPYVIAADIYGAKNLAGRGGWTWYTGSSSWYYKTGIEYILGLKIEKETIKFKPCIPKEWKEYEIKYKWKSSIYNIKIENPNGENSKIDKIYLNNKEIENKIKLKDDGKVYSVKIIMGI